MTRRGAKVSDVWNVRVTLRAVARCEGVDGDPTPCRWQPFYPIDDRDVRRQARQHVADTLDHEVVVDVVDSTKYYLQQATIDTLRAPDDSTGPETPPDAQRNAEEN